jgi:hypothetical protein
MLRSWGLVLPLSLLAASASAHAQAPAPVVLIGGEADQGGPLEHPWALTVLPGLIVVLERGAPFLKLFGTDGRLRQQTVRAGSGPGEFREPHAMAFDPVTRRLVVFDPPNGRADYFILDDTLRYETSRRTTVNPLDACFLGGKLYALELIEGRIIHELAGRGAELSITRSLGAPRSSHPLAAHEMFQGTLAQGPMLCDEAGNRIVAASRGAGTIQVVSLGSEPQRTVQPPGFIPLNYSATATSLTMGFPPGGESDLVAGIRPDADGFRIIAGRANREHRGLGEYAYYREFVVTATGVRPNPAVTHWAEIGMDGRRVVCYQGSPYPTVAIFAGSRCP